jgi:hypothetical protein
MRKKISQLEARRLQKRVAELDRTFHLLKHNWQSDWDQNWVNIGTVQLHPVDWIKVRTARRLGHAVVAVDTDNDKIWLYADRLEK